MEIAPLQAGGLPNQTAVHHGITGTPVDVPGVLSGGRPGQRGVELLISRVASPSRDLSP